MRVPLLTLKLWRLLYYPDMTNPLFRHIVLQQAIQEAPPINWKLVQPWLTRLALVVVLAVLLVDPLKLILALIIIPVSLLSLLVLLPLSLPVIMNVVGGMWTAEIGGELARQRLLRRYDLISVSLDGSLHTSWMIAAACIHRGYLFVALHACVRAAIIISALLMGGLLLLTLSVADGLPEAHLIRAVRTGVDVVALLAGFYAYYMQTLVLCIVTGMAMSAYIDNPFEVRVMGVMTFVGVQLGSLVVLALLGSALFAPLETLLLPAAPAVFIMLPLVYLAGWLALREAMIAALWYMITERLNGSPVEQALLIEAGEG
jgi:hypothetical protein